MDASGDHSIEFELDTFYHTAAEFTPVHILATRTHLIGLMDALPKDQTAISPRSQGIFFAAVKQNKQPCYGKLNEGARRNHCALWFGSMVYYSNINNRMIMLHPTSKNKFCFADIRVYDQTAIGCVQDPENKMGLYDDQETKIMEQFYSYTQGNTNKRMIYDSIPVVPQIHQLSINIFGKTNVKTDNHFPIFKVDTSGKMVTNTVNNG
jgi:hypothetical protein